MRRRRGFAGWIVLAVAWPLALCLTAGGQTSALRQKVGAAVARDLRMKAEAEIVANSLQVLASLTVPPESELHVVSAKPGNAPGTWLLRMDCSTRRDCLPFDVVLHSHSHSDFDAAVRDGSHRDGSNAFLPAKNLGEASQPRLPLARAGDRVLLVEERAGMRLKTKAICLQAGAAGDTIRVLNLATHQVLLATVAGKDQDHAGVK